MTTIRAYTTIEQSRKLAKILPIESADMYYDRGGLPSLIDKYVTHESIKNDKYHHLIPCWSLAALYGILPNNEKESTTLSRGGWNIEPIKYLDNWWCEYEDESHTKDFTVSADTPIDACVDMIEKLHEFKML